MFSWKNQLILLFICIALPLSLQADDEEDDTDKTKNDILIGIKGKHDKLVFDKTVHKRAKVWNRRDVISFKTESNQVISAINISNLDLNHPASQIHIYDGGVGERSVTINIRSMRAKAYTYKIEIYAKKQ